jgi:hypothetical protein
MCCFFFTLTKLKRNFRLEEPGFCRMPIICARATKINADCRVQFQVAGFSAKLPSFMPSKMPIAKFYAKFFEIKALLLVLVPGTTFVADEENTTNTQQTPHTR